MTTRRLEAFSDGVIAVAITLLVLDLTVPQSGVHLAQHLGHEWPKFVAYAVSFLTIGIIWINHHAALLRLREADHTVLVLNLLVLMAIGLLPFATALMATYLQRAHGEHLAAAVYAAAFLFMGVTFSLLNWRILGRPRLLVDGLSEAARLRILRRSVAGVSPYALATGLAFVSPYLTLGICGAVAAFYAMPLASDG
jgi:uncharacterized membrane protein